MGHRLLFIFATALSIGCCEKSCHAFEYVFKDLGKLDIEPSGGNGLNSVGNVTGYFYITGETYGHAFLYDGSMHDLGTFGGHDSFGTSINDLNQVTGGSNSATPGVIRAFLYDGMMNDLGTLGGPTSIGYGINGRGQVVGYADTTSNGTHSFLWTPNVPNGTNGTMYDLGTLVNDNRGASIAYAISRSGQVTGFAQTSDGSSHAFLWTPTISNGNTGTMYDLGKFGGSRSAGNAINEKGQIVGYSFTDDGDEVYHAFLWTPTTPNGNSGSMKDLGTLSGTQSNAYGINSSGQVVGFAGLAGDLTAHAFLYTEATGMIDLNTLIDPQLGWVLQNATGINDGGQITGYGYDSGGHSHAFLLTPVPEPSGLLMAAIASLLATTICTFNRRRHCC